MAAVHPAAAAGLQRCWPSRAPCHSPKPALLAGEAQAAAIDQEAVVVQGGAQRAQQRRRRDAERLQGRGRARGRVCRGGSRGGVRRVGGRGRASEGAAAAEQRTRLGCTHPPPTRCPPAALLPNAPLASHTHPGGQTAQRPGPLVSRWSPPPRGAGSLGRRRPSTPRPRWRRGPNRSGPAAPRAPPPARRPRAARAGRSPGSRKSRGRRGACLGAP